MIVVDTNLIVYLYLESKHSPLAEQVLMKDPEWHAPLLWRSEFRLAQVLGVPLVTVDKQILKDFPETAVSLASFIGAPI